MPARFGSSVAGEQSSNLIRLASGQPNAGPPFGMRDQRTLLCLLTLLFWLELRSQPIAAERATPPEPPASVVQSPPRAIPTTPLAEPSLLAAPGVADRAAALGTPANASPGRPAAAAAGQPDPAVRPTAWTEPRLLPGTAQVEPAVAADALGELRLRVEQLEQQLSEATRGIASAPPGTTDPLPAVTPAAAVSPAGAGTESPDLSPDSTVLDDLLAQMQDLKSRLADQKSALPKIVVNGVFQADLGWYHQDPNSRTTFGNPLFPGTTTPPHPDGILQDGADFRRARLAASGQITPNMTGFFQMDFAFFGRPTFTDVWGEYTDLPWLQHVRIGQWKMPFSLEVVSSFRYTTFAERSLLFQAFAPFRHLAVGTYGTWGPNLNGTYAGAIYRAGQDQYGGTLSRRGGYACVGRLTWVPLYDEPSGGRYYLHLGGAYAFVNPALHLARFRTTPEIYIGETGALAVGTSGVPVPGIANGTPFFVDTGNIRTRGYNEWGTELLWVEGPLSLQSEVMAVSINQVNGQHLTYWGQYLTLGYFLTGEHRPYDRRLGVIDRVIPFEDFFRLRSQPRGIVTGKGAWEVAARWSFIDLNSRPIAFDHQPNWNSTGGGGRLHDVTIGLNWYLNPYSKIQFNYIRAMLHNNTYGDSNTDIFDLRYQMDF